MISAVSPSHAEKAVSLLEILDQELHRSMQNLGTAQKVPMYYLQYAVTEENIYSLTISDGAFEAPRQDLRRYLDVDMRVGDEKLDNTHEIREGNWQDYYLPHRSVAFPIENDAQAIAGIVWQETEYQFLKAQERMTKILTNRNVKVDEQDKSNDFSPAPVQKFIEPELNLKFDETVWKPIFKKVGEYFAQFPEVYSSRAWIWVNEQTTYLVSSDGHRLVYHYPGINLGMTIYGMASDGMDLTRQENYSALNFAHLPSESEIMNVAERLVVELKSLIQAPVVEPYSGPAILRNRASAVFFHEIFGHRMEGHRQKSENEGQTFTRKVGQMIMPEFISIYDDPTLMTFKGIDLNGTYKYDDEGSVAQRVCLVEKGVLRNFLMSRSPIENFSATNGHGRRQRGYSPVARQGNLLIESAVTVPYNRLRELLIAECKKRGKPYGLIFDDISGGETSTQRYNPQAFKVVPLYVHRVYVDGRPDEVVRGVDIVGTPITVLGKILATADDPDVFNGSCGAESGWVPVSAISPSILVSEIEVEKRYKRQSKPPILSSPNFENHGKNKP